MLKVTLDAHGVKSTGLKWFFSESNRYALNLGTPGWRKNLQIQDQGIKIGEH